MNEPDPMVSSVYPGDNGTPPPPPSLSEQATIPALVAVLPSPRRSWLGLPLVGGVFGLVTALFLISVVTIYGVIHSHNHLFSAAPASAPQSQSNPHATQTLIALQTAMTATPAVTYPTPTGIPTAGATPTPPTLPLPLIFTCSANQGYKNAQVCANYAQCPIDDHGHQLRWTT